MSLSPTKLTLRHLREQGWPLVEVTEAIKRLLPRVIIDDHGCWIWTGAVDKATGYGRCNARTYGHHSTHRLFYVELIGPIPDGLQLDHLCRVRSCCNPKHLEPVTQSVNSKRSPLIGRAHANKTHCINGHPRTPENLYVHAKSGHRHCRICKLERQRATRRAT